MKKLSYLLIIISLIFLGAGFAAPALAANVLGGENVNVTKVQDQNVYAGGGQIIVAGELKKDLLVVGGDIALNSRIGQDVLAAGSNIKINKPVGGDVRIAGGNINIDAPIGGDVLVFGGTINMSGDTVIDGDALVFGGQIVINGDVRGSASINGGDVVINGNILGNTEVRASRITINGRISKQAKLSADRINLGDRAAFLDGVRYYASAGKLDFGDKVKNGEAIYDQGLALSTPQVGHRQKSFAKMAAWFLVSLLAAALVMLVFLAHPSKNMRVRTLKGAARFVSGKFWKALLAGLLFFIVVPIVSVLLLITVIGLPLGLAGLAVFAFSVYAAPIVAAIVFAKWLEIKTKASWGGVTFYFVSLGLLVILKLLHLIPFVGGLIVLVVALVGFGALMLAKKELHKKVENSLADTAGAQ